MLNWIVWNRTDYLYKIDLTLNNLQGLIYHKIQTTNQATYWLCSISDVSYKDVIGLK